MSPLRTWNMQLASLGWSSVALMVGALLGWGFSVVQQRAVTRHKKIMEAGGLKGGWAVVPGSARRVAFLLLVLVLVQILCPVLFREGTGWWVTLGILASYGALLARQLRQRKSL